MLDNLLIHAKKEKKGAYGNNKSKTRSVGEYAYPR